MVGSILLVHGYGVRGSFWEKLQPRLQRGVETVSAPDFEGTSPQQLAAQIEQLARSNAATGPIALVGHSLGGILCALVASRVDPAIVSHLVLIAAPFGGRASSVNPILRFLIRFRLLPQFVVRPRFFSSATRLADQKRWFSRAVPESPELQDILFSSQWFPVDAFTAPLPQRSLAVYSCADRIVDPAATQLFARTLGAHEYVFDQQRGIGHNDFAASDSIAEETAAAILAFINDDRTGTGGAS